MSSEYEYIVDEVEAELLPNLARFVRIPNQSREYDPEWETNGLLKKAATFVTNWAAQQELKNFKLELLEEKGRTPSILVTIDSPAKPEKNVLIYGHIDKQPPLTEQWHSGKQPYVPVYEKGKLYGRGSGDDGYAFFTAILLVKTLQKFNLQKHRFVLFFESDEESDSKDLLYFMEKRKEVIGKPDIILCLDSEAVDEKRLTLTGSLRGVFDVAVRFSTSEYGVHSGDSSGIIPDSFRILRHFLKSIENSDNGKVNIEEFNANIPENCYREAQELVQLLGPDYKFPFPFLPGVQPTVKTVLEQYINGTWKPQMTEVGINGVPKPIEAGNVLRPFTEIALSFRLPPTVSADAAEAAFKKHMDSYKPLYNAKLDWRVRGKGTGFVTDKLPEALANKVNEASKKFFGNPNVSVFVGGSIPFMSDFKKAFPDSVFILTGIMTATAGAHGPNEYADIEYLKKFLCAMLFIFR